MASSDAHHQPNDLDRALDAAASDPTAASEFYRTLLESQVWVIGKLSDDSPPPGGAHEDGTVPSGAKVQLGHNRLEDGTPYVPFFSAEHLVDTHVGADVPRLRVAARELLAMTAGTTVALNPGAARGTVMPPEVVKRILTGGALDEIQTDAGREMTLGLPATDPLALTAALTTVLARYPDVSHAYYCQADMNDGTAPHLIVGIDGSGDLVPAIKDAGATAQRVQGSGEVVDFLDMRNDDSGLGEYLRDNGSQFYSVDL